MAAEGPCDRARDPYGGRQCHAERHFLRQPWDADPEVRSAATTLLNKLPKASLIIYAYDRAGKPLANAEGSVKLYDQSRADLENEVPARQPPAADRQRLQAR